MNDKTLQKKRLMLRGVTGQNPPVEQCFVASLNLPLRLGRCSRELDKGVHYGSDLVFPGDNTISNYHAEVRWDGTGIVVRRRAGVKNPIVFLNNTGTPDEGWVPIDGQFRIGNTVFTLQAEPEEVIPEPDNHQEWIRTAEELRTVAFSSPKNRIASLAAIVELGADASTLTCDRFLELLIEGIPRAELAAMIVAPSTTDANPSVVDVRFRRGDIHWQFSTRLVRRAALGFLPVAYEWCVNTPASEINSLATHTHGLDWAICVRLRGEADEVVYLSGRNFPPGRDKLDEDMKFVQLAADIFAGQRQLLAIETRARFLSRFVPQPVRIAISHGTHSPEQATTARVSDVTVFFCDLRGYTGMVEQGEALLDTWGRMSIAINIMTAAIVQAGGMVGGFRGDAVLAFWGWPQPYDNQIERAIQAALTIRRQFIGLADNPDHPLGKMYSTNQGLPIGIGLAHGPAVVGRLGAGEQLEFGLFGPVINKASRLESATKAFRVPILISPEVLEAVDGKPWAGFRSRPLANVRLQGVKDGQRVGEILPTLEDNGKVLSEEHRRRYLSALQLFQAGEWNEFLRLTEPMQNDGPTLFIRRYIESLRVPPSDWDGHIPLSK